MQKRIIINIARPEVGVEYQPATSEAEITDMAAAIELGLHALAQSNPSGGPDPGRIKHTRVYNRLSCPTSYVVTILVSRTRRKAWSRSLGS
jgi:hypothetical protein